MSETVKRVTSLLSRMTLAGKPSHGTDAGSIRENDEWIEMRVSNMMADRWRKWRIDMKSDFATKHALKAVLLTQSLRHVGEERGKDGGYVGKPVTYPPSLKKERVMLIKVRAKNDTYRISESGRKVSHTRSASHIRDFGIHHLPSIADTIMLSAN